MAYRPETRQDARQLRQDGWSIKRIAGEIGVAPSTVSLWTRDIVLTESQRADLLWRPPTCSQAAGAASRRIAAEKTAASHLEAQLQWERLRADPDFMFGLALYVGEGRKGTCGAVSISNTDPRVLRASKTFFNQIGLADARMRVSVHVPKGGRTSEEVVAHWGAELGLSAEHFNKVISVSRRKKGNKYPFGTCAIKVSDIFTKRKLNLWMELALDQHPG